MNEEIQKVLKMSKEGTLTDEQAAELIAELAKKESQASRQWRNESSESLGDTISALIGKTMDGAIQMSAMAGKNTSHVEGFQRGDLEANSFHMSRVDAPSGSDFVFRGNQVRMSRLSRLVFDRSEFVDSQVDASKLDELKMADSRIAGTVFQASALEEFGLDHAQVSDSKILSSKWARVSIDGESALGGVKINACSVRGLKISNHSAWRKTVLSGMAVADLSCDNTSVTDLEGQHAHLAHSALVNCAWSGVLLRGVHWAHVRWVDSRLNDVLFTGGHEKWSWKPWKGRGFEKVSFEGCKFDKVLFSDCAWSDVNIRNVTQADLKIQGVNLSGRTIDGNEEFAKALEEGKTR